MKKSIIKEYLRKQGIVKFQLGEVKKTHELCKDIQNQQPETLGRLYKVYEGREYWICIKVNKYSQYNIMQRIHVKE